NPPTTEPAGFSVANPPRIAFGFTNTDNKVGKDSLELPQGDVRSVAIVQSGERERVVLNLKRALIYNTSIDGNTLVVALVPVATADAAAAPSAYSFAKVDGKGTHSLRHSDFRRG